MSISQTLQRPIRSFVIRASRMTNRQRHAIEHHWGDYGIDLTDGLEDVTTCFKNAAPVVLEIGFGMGDSLVKLAQSRPDVNFIGVEVHPPGVGACVASASEAGLKNLLVIRDDAIEVLQHHVKNHSLHQVQILFPDPWHKKKHHKRRLIQADLISLLARKIIVDGSLRIATDWMPYAEHIESVFHGSSLFVEHQDCHDDMRVQTRINETKFEMRGKRLGHKIVDFWYTRMA